MSGIVAERVRHPLQPRLLTVRAVERVTPTRVSIVLTGDLAGLRSLSPDDHLKLIFPPAPGIDPPLPQAGPDGVRYPPGVPRPEMRDYTPRSLDAEAGELVVEFVLHGDGPASGWAASARPGDRIGQVGPRGSLVVSGVRHWVLAGDESALPAIARRLDELGDATATVLVEVEGPAERVPLADADPDRVSVTWLYRAPSPPGASDALVTAIRALPSLDEDAFVWVAAEAGVARAIRAHLRDERGLASGRMRVTGYWRRGTANHHDG